MTFMKWRKDTGEARNHVRRAVQVGCAGGLLLMFGCKTVNTEIVIEAKPATVWKIVSDAPGFERWNPVHVKIDGVFREGEKITIHLKDGAGKVSAFPATVRKVVPGVELNSGGGFPGLFTFSHTFRLEPHEQGTRLTHREEFRGIGVPFFQLDWVDSSYRSVNEAVKARAENLERDGQ